MDIFCIQLFGKPRRKNVDKNNKDESALLEHTSSSLSKSKNKMEDVFIQKCASVIEKINLKEIYLQKLVDSHLSDIKLLQTSQDLLKKNKQLNHLKMIHLYNDQRKKLLDLKFQIQKINVTIDNAIVLENIQQTLFEGSETLKHINEKMENNNVDDIMSNIQESLEKIKETEEVMKGDDNSNHGEEDEELMEELEKIIRNSKREKTTKKNNGRKNDDDDLLDELPNPPSSLPFNTNKEVDKLPLLLSSSNEKKKEMAT